MFDIELKDYTKMSKEELADYIRISLIDLAFGHGLFGKPPENHVEHVQKASDYYFNKFESETL